MPRIPSRIQQQPFGAFNPTTAGRTPPPALQPRGPAMPTETFSDQNLDPNVKRALIQLQSNVRQSTAQAKGSPFAYANIISGWTLKNGSANGVGPNVIAHGLGQPATGAFVISTYGGFVTAQATIPNPPTSDLIQLWTTYTAFAGVSTVTADILVYA